VKKRIKSSYCTNCGKVLQEADNYCPNCGQENDNKRQTFGKVMSHLILDFLHIDSRVTQSIPALLFRPGYLTKEYLKGKRQQYLDPIKMFITIVVVYFILASFGNHSTIDFNNAVTDSSGVVIKPADSVLVFSEGPFKLKANYQQPDSLIDSTGTMSQELELDVPEYKKIKGMVKRGRTDTREILDSLQIESTFWNRFYYGEIIKFVQSDMQEFRDFLISKMPWLIFCIVPLFALLLKVLYYRRDFLYIDHLIFSFHLHTFFFLVGIIYLVLLGLSGISISIWLLAITILYSLLAFKNFYKQDWWKIILKSILLVVTYSITTLISFILLLIFIFILF